MILKFYVYSLAFILNYFNFSKSYNGSIYYSLFFIFRNVVFVVIFNFIFNFMMKIFRISFLNIEILVLIFIISILLYFLKRKYICISFSGTLVYLICKVLNIEISLNEIMFLISSLHIFEGLFIIFSLKQVEVFSMKENNFLKGKLYLPLILNKFPIIFMIFYNRKFYNISFKYTKFVSGVLIFVYGIIVLFISLLKKNIVSLILIWVLHELIIFVEKFIFKKIERVKLIENQVTL